MVSARDTLSQAELALVAEVVGAVGTADFYHRVLGLLDERIGCERRLVIKYSRYARPQIVVNASLDADAVRFYLDSLYRLDPLLRLVRADAVRPVVTYREIRRVDHENAFYDEIFRSGRVFDELAILLPTLGGACVALCFDRDEGDFGSHETEWASLLYPVLRQAHDLHVRTALSRGLNSLFGDGDAGILALGEDGAVLYRNTAWRRLVRGADEAAIVAQTLAQAEGDATEIGASVGHWEFLEPPLETGSPPGVLAGGADHGPDGGAAGPRSYRAVFLEKRSAGYIDRNMRGMLAGFIAANRLSSRESQILEKMMRGYPTAAIADKLGLTSGTVKNYKRRLYDKLDITHEREVFPLFINHLLAVAEAPAAAADPNAGATQAQRTAG